MEQFLKVWESVWMSVLELFKTVFLFCVEKCVVLFESLEKFPFLAFMKVVKGFLNMF